MAARGAKHTAARVATFVEPENVDAPYVCTVCLGPGKSLRMIKKQRAKECNVCSRPFATFAWRVSRDARMTTTVICRGCAEAKLCCQSCLCDVTTGLPLDVVAKLSIEERQQRMLVHKKRIEREEEAGEPLGQGDTSAAAATASAVGDLLGVLPQKQDQHQHGRQRYQRFEQRVCSFFAKGKCTRGAACPFRHVLPEKEDNDEDEDEGSDVGDARTVNSSSSKATAQSSSRGGGLTDMFEMGGQKKGGGQEEKRKKTIKDRYLGR